jgi:hypothetical protein
MKNWILIFVLVLSGYAFGRYSAPEKIKTEVKTVEVEKIVTKVQHQTITIHENKDGSKDTVIITNTNTGEQTKAKSKEEAKEIVFKENKINVSLLFGGTYPFSSLNYGLSFQRNIIGPITAGTWILNNSTGGISVGINF